MIRQRSIVNQTKIKAGRERVRMLCSDGALGRHTCVANRMRAIKGFKTIARNDVFGPARFIKDLDMITRPDNPQF